MRHPIVAVLVCTEHQLVCNICVEVPVRHPIVAVLVCTEYHVHVYIMRLLVLFSTRWSSTRQNESMP